MMSNNLCTFLLVAVLLVTRTRFMYAEVIPATRVSENHEKNLFSADFLQPPIPSDAIFSSYTLFDELSSWSDLSITHELIKSFPGLLQEFSSTSPILFFAPTNDAFYRLLKPFLPNFSDFDARQVVKVMKERFDVISIFNPKLPTLSEIILYHIVEGNFTEQNIFRAGAVNTTFGRPLNVTLYPSFIQDVDPLLDSMRLGRQVENSNGRIVIINNLLLPIDISQVLKEGGIPELGSASEAEIIESQRLFRPLVSPTDFISSRRDLQVFSELILTSDALNSTVAEAPFLHFFAPTNRAFMTFAGTILSRKNATEVLPREIEDCLRNETHVAEFAKKFRSIWKTTEGELSLIKILAQHVLNSTSSFKELVNAGPQETISSGGGERDVITIAQGVVQGSNGSIDSHLISSFATQGGYISIIDRVLIPESFNREVVEAAPMEDSEDILLPKASETPEMTIYPRPSPMVLPIETPAFSTESTEATVNNVNAPACFPSSGIVMLANGSKVMMKELNVGDNIYVGRGTSSPVFLFTHKQPNIMWSFIRLHTESGYVVTLTPGHYLFVNGELAAAVSVTVGDYLETENGISKVRCVENVWLRGLYAPHTLHGDLLVDGVLVSGYSTAIDPQIAHALLAPVRMLVRFTGIPDPFCGLLYRGGKGAEKILPSGGLRYLTTAGGQRS